MPSTAKSIASITGSLSSPWSRYFWRTCRGRNGTISSEAEADGGCVGVCCVGGGGRDSTSIFQIAGPAVQAESKSPKLQMTEVANAHVGRLLLTTLRPGWSAYVSLLVA